MTHFQLGLIFFSLTLSVLETTSCCLPLQYSIWDHCVMWVKISIRLERRCETILLTKIKSIVDFQSKLFLFCYPKVMITVKLVSGVIVLEKEEKCEIEKKCSSWRERSVLAREFLKQSPLRYIISQMCVYSYIVHGSKLFFVQ